MNEFGAYVDKLEMLAAQYIGSTLSLVHDRDELIFALNGGPNRALREIIPLKILQETGTYFTGDVLANLALKNSEQNFFASKICDPACGVGDLLISATKYLPIAPNLTETLETWGNQLLGYDLHSEFIRATKIRLLLTALSRGVRIDRNPINFIDDIFPNIKVNNGLEIANDFSSPCSILLNPPFHPVKTPKGCKWANGKISIAALFLDKWIAESAAGTKIIAILPDVLRSGSFYQHWRENIIAKAKVDEIKIYGKFDSLTEVDVFILRLTVTAGNNQESSTEWWESADEKSKTIGDFFEISVGRIVPHRDAEEGPEYDYIQPKTLPKWQELKSISERRRFSGKISKPPFVVIRRNSRSDDKYRASGTIINSPNSVAVENHLVILKPKDEKLKTCRKLLEVLKLPETNNWLNQRIRCRHLTVPAVKEIPWIEATK